MRTYSERQVSAIIERAVERQQAAEEGGGEAGLTLDEIERIGRESDIDPAHLRAAAAEIDEAGRTLSRQSGQSPTHVYVERWVDAPLSAVGWEDAVAELRTRLGASSGSGFGTALGETVQRVGRSYEWTHTSPYGVRTRVTVSPRGDRTRLHLTQLVGMSTPMVDGVVVGGVLAVLVAALAGGAAEALGGAAWLAVLLTLVVTWAIAAPAVAIADRRWRARKLRDLGALADDLVPTLRGPDEDARAGTPSAEASPASPRLDLDALPDSPDESGWEAGRGRVRG